MRIKRVTVFSTICLMLWGTVTFYIFLNRPYISNHEKNVLDNKINALEKIVREEFSLNRNTIEGLSEAVKLKRQDLELSQKRDSAENEIVDEPPKPKNLKFEGPIIPILVFACNRVTVVRCIEQLIRYRPDEDQFPIIVSQDCGDTETEAAIRSFGSQVTYIKQPDQTDIQVLPKEKKFKGYFKIARHYGWALNQTFFNFNFDSVIIVEDDLDIAPDFYEYFLGAYPILLKDPTLWCVSAWNDNGKVGLVDENRPDLLYRTDFFPGLGWMLTKKLWLELSHKWPKAYWDDWIRQPEQRLDRACIRPELSRTRTFGKIGVSNGLFFEKHLKFIKLNDKYVPFTQLDLNYLTKDIYDPEFIRTVYQSAVVSYQELKENKIAYDGAVRIPYHTKDAYKRTAKLLGLMDDFRSGVPRMAYRGVVTFRHNNRTVFLAPNINWKGYDITWS